MTTMSLKGSDSRGYQQISNVSAAVALNVPAGAKCIVVHAEGQAVRWRDDGASPTASVGMLLPVGGELRYDGSLLAIRFIETAASAKINVAFYS